MDYSFQYRSNLEYAKRHFHPAVVNAIAGDRDAIRKAVQARKNEPVDEVINTIRKARSQPNPALLMAGQL